MPWGAAILVVLAVTILAGCGEGGSTDPVESADKHLEQVEGEYLLAKVELDRAWYRQAEMGQKEKPAKTYEDEFEDLADARRVLKRCIEGDGLESCSEVEPIRGIVTELDHAHRHPG
jgi:hypothetical protein